MIKKNKKIFLIAHKIFIMVENEITNAFKGELFPLKSTTGTEPKVLAPKQKLQRLPITLAQVKAGTNSECLLNEIRQIVYSLYQSKQITKKVCNNIIK